ncbi:MAG: SIMPL domain-containing protein [Alphaproteobacteria bacterium]
MKKNIILPTILAILLVFAIFYPKRPEQIKTISVTGECTTTIPRDKTAITLRVKTLNENSAISVHDATELARKITDFVKTQPATAQTTDFTSYEKTQWNKDAEKYEVLGTQTEIAIEISSNTIETIETILTEFMGEQNVYSDNLRMYASTNETRHAMESCLTEAIKNAQNRASAMAAASDMKIGKMLNASYGTQPKIEPISRNMPMLAAKAYTADSIDASGTLSTTETEISVSVNATFELR